MSFAIIEITDSKKFMTGYVDTSVEFKHRLEQKYPKARFHQNISIKDLKNFLFLLFALDHNSR